MWLTLVVTNGILERSALPSGFTFQPKHKSNAYSKDSEGGMAQAQMEDQAEG